jgi:hypothetical protein
VKLCCFHCTAGTTACFGLLTLHIPFQLPLPCFSQYMHATIVQLRVTCQGTLSLSHLDLALPCGPSTTADEPGVCCLAVCLLLLLQRCKQA